jgi:manganese transport protein
VSRALALTLGVVTALGGFVDIGELVFGAQAGARFGYALLWPVVLGAVSIIVYSEMCGRVAIVTGKPVFAVLRDRLGYSVGFSGMLAAAAVNVLTCTAEVGGVAIVLRLLTGIAYGPLVAAAILVLIVTMSALRFDLLERFFGLLGLLMLTFVASAVALGIDWSALAAGLVPRIPDLPAGGPSPVSFAYFAVGLLAGTVMPYEVQFYSSGNIEESKTTDDLRENALIASIGMSFGAVVTIAIVVVAAQALLPQGITPDALSATVLGPLQAFGQLGLVAALLGALFAVGGASVETSLAGAYAFAQFLGFEWGKEQGIWRVPRFTLSWLAIFGLAALILVTGVDPIEVTEFAVILSVVVLPLTYLPILLAARDRRAMGRYRNNRLEDALGIACFGLILLAAVLAVPLLYLSRMGQA